jgi:hypothetical protein
MSVLVLSAQAPNRDDQYPPPAIQYASSAYALYAKFAPQLNMYTFFPHPATDKDSNDVCLFMRGPRQ